MALAAPSLTPLRRSAGIGGHDRQDFTGSGGDPLSAELRALERRTKLLEDLLRSGLSFGVPTSINESGTASGQRIGHMRGAWVHQTISALGTNTFTHNLGLPTPAGKVNVRWLVFGWQHDGNGAGTGDTLSVNYQGGTVATDSIQLYVTAAGARTVDGTHQLTVDLYFVPADG